MEVIKLNYRMSTTESFYYEGTAFTSLNYVPPLTVSRVGILYCKYSEIFVYSESCILSSSHKRIAISLLIWYFLYFGLSKLFPCAPFTGTKPVTQAACISMDADPGTEAIELFPGASWMGTNTFQLSKVSRFSFQVLLVACRALCE